MKKIITIIVLALFVNTITAQKMSPYKIYNAKGEQVTYKKMMKTLTEKDIVLFGELHNNAIAHWLQYEVTNELHKSRQLILGAEMMEADNQNELNDYLKGEIDAKKLDTVARLWPNYKTDYAPLINFAKDNNLPFVATNIPRRFASKVYKGGWSALNELTAEEKMWVAPLPITFDANIPTYVEILAMMGEHGSPELVMAQASKDATMAHFILKNYTTGSLFIHYNGAFHSDKYEGILWYLKLNQPNLNYGTISTVSQDNINTLEKENFGKADFTIVVDSNMTDTY
jgi:uncharacterized iron-regulated protein